eukprot:TRINITY_DN20037_c0_g1_i1.p1 TRINITY_DN20037_c0_g1~~TRINITY_DN20037_c0_g1_i1.p1  ORF type:complete len:1596 (-),score=324.97 TRINITY_DN20037_c0_g1_i1:41-4828(-)
MQMTEVEDENNIEVCDFCNSEEKNILKFGKAYKFENYLVHHFCLLFASALPQNGEDSEGVLGFLKEDIEKELIRGEKTRCNFCDKKGATIGCIQKKCKISFHYQCSLENKGLFQFFDTFPAWCSEHRPVQSVFMHESQEEKAKRSCGICLELIAGQTSQLWAPCCGGFFDSQCVSKLAATSGYFFKCPLCNNKDVFNIEMKKFGIHVPDQDADWDNEPGAYSSLLERYTRCDAELCSCEEGRNYDEDDTIYEIILCRTCGSSGIHIQCGKLKLSDPVFLCNVCKGPEMAKEEEENESGRRKSLRGKPSEAGQTSATRKLQLEKVVKSPTPSKNPRKTKCSQPNPKECLQSETAFEDPIAAQPVDINNKPKRGRRKPNIANVDKPKNNVIPELKGSKQISKPKRGKVKNVAETPNCTEKSDADPKQSKSNAKINSKGKGGEDFILLTDTRQSEDDFKQNETGESSQTNTDSKDDMKCPVVIKIDPSILDIVGPGSEDHTAGSELVKSEAHEEELDTELFDLANQINFNFEIPSSPLRPINEATPSKLRTPIKNSPAKRLPKKNLINEISSSPLKENRRGRLRTPQTTPIKENAVVNNTNKNPSVTSPNVSRRSGHKSEQVHETKHVPKCALNLNESNISEVQANNKDKDLLDKEIYSDKSIDKNIQNQSAKINNLSNARTLSKTESVVNDPGGQTGDTSRSQRVSRKRECTSAGQSQKGCLPKPCKERETPIISSTPQKPLIIKLGVKTTQGTPNGPDCKKQADQILNSVSKLSEAELRKNRLEHAKIRVKINELMDKLDSALASQDYAEAEVVKLSLDDQKEKQKQLEDVANGFRPDSEAKPNLDKISHSEIPKEKKPPESTPIVNSVGGKRKRTELKNDPPMIAEPTAQQERTSKRLRTITSIPLGLPNQKENKETPEKTTVSLTEIKESPRKTRTKGPIKTSPQKKQSDNTVIENYEGDIEINCADETSDRLGTSKCIERKEKSKINIDSTPENPKVQSLATEIVRNSISSSSIASESKLKSISRETSPVQDLSSRRSPRKSTNNVSNEKDKATSMHSDKISSINKSFPKLEDIRLKPFCINLFNINSNKLLHSVTKKRSTQIILHLNKYLINKSGKPHSKQKLLKRRLDDSIRKMSDSLTSIEEEISRIIAQEKLRQNKKIILHLNLKNKSVIIKTITQDEQSNQQKEKVRRTGRPRTEDTKEAPNQKTQVKHSKVVDQRHKHNVEQKDKQSEVRRSGRSRTEEAPIQKTHAKATKLKKAVSETKSPIKISKAVPTSKPTSRRRKVNNTGTAPYPYATETTLEEELFYQICPLKPTSQPKGVNNQSSGRIGEKRNNTRRILISMQKLGRSPILDRPLSFVAFTFDGSNLISHETVDELKERTHNIKSSIKKPINKLIENTNNKIKKSVKISKLHNSVKKNKISIWKSSKFNSRIKTMISKNGTIQMTVNKETTSEVPNGLNVSKYFKIRRTSSFSPASNKSTSPTSRHEMLSETQKEKQFEMNKPVDPRIMSENQNPTPSTPEQESVISPMKIKIPKDLWVKAKKDKRLLKLEKKQASVKQRSNASPKTVKVKYKNLYGRVIEYAKNLPRKN